MQFTTSLLSLLLSASSVLAQNSICGSQIYTPGTGQCFDGLLCLYAEDPTTGLKDIITFPCGSQCYNAASYVCSNGELLAATGTASTAVLTSTAAQTQTSGATAPATPVQSGAIISSQSRAASSAAKSNASTSTQAASSSTTSKSSALKISVVDTRYLALGGAASLVVLSGILF